MLAVILVGFLFGFVGSMPIAGPIAVLVFAAATDGRPRRGLYIAIGCSLAEGTYAALAFWGFSRFLTEYPFIVPVSRALAAVLLFGLGIAFLRRKRVSDGPRREETGRGSSFALGFSITALNPTLIGTWAGATTVLFSTGLVALRPSLSVLFGAAAASGIVAWFVVLIALVRRLGERLRAETMDRVVRVMGVFLLCVAGWFTVQLGTYAFAQ